jgi:DNA-binding response OmpR family regulator
MDLTGRTILVVEDEPLIRLDTSARLQAAGAQVLAAAELNSGLSLADDLTLSAAVLDFHLVSSDTTQLCWKLVDRRIPFLFYTGQRYSALDQWPDAPVILKPAAALLVAAVVTLRRS